MVRGPQKIDQAPLRKRALSVSKLRRICFPVAVRSKRESTLFGLDRERSDAMRDAPAPGDTAGFSTGKANFLLAPPRLWC
jgi:hypothetical protein